MHANVFSTSEMQYRKLLLLDWWTVETLQIYPSTVWIKMTETVLKQLSMCIKSNFIDESNRLQLLSNQFELKCLSIQKDPPFKLLSSKFFYMHSLWETTMVLRQMMEKIA